ncbi:hypothetical protein [Flammeovirga sp. SubArs3]|uniref:hypothetical protein n=1 Tax=Flammeovirga sp. SubArs3 TaxID=2995316 RepID=UPI00248ACD61|nr:hypothetical protein [Flammeovirga sp. SubArs3]
MKTLSTTLLSILLLFISFSCKDAVVDPSSINNIYFETDEEIMVGLPGYDTTLMSVQLLFQANEQRLKSVITGDVALPPDAQVFGESANMIIELEVQMSVVTQNTDFDYSFIVEDTDNITRRVTLEDSDLGVECQEIDNQSRAFGRRVEGIESIQWDSDLEKYYITLDLLSDLFPGATTAVDRIYQKEGVLTNPCQ